MKKEYTKPLYEIETITFNDVILVSGIISKSDTNHSFGDKADLSI